MGADRPADVVAHAVATGTSRRLGLTEDDACQRPLPLHHAVAGPVVLHVTPGLAGAGHSLTSPNTSRQKASPSSGPSSVSPMSAAFSMALVILESEERRVEKESR